MTSRAVTTSSSLPSTSLPDGDKHLEANQDADTCATRNAKGKFLAIGVTGIVELLATGEVMKSPRPGDDEHVCRKEMNLEAQVYRRIKEKIGPHQRFLRCILFDEVAATLTLEYMPVGTLRDYLLSHGIDIAYEQRYQWALAATEGLQLLHSIAVVHCDFSPKNMLLDSSLALKVTDFGCSSIDGNPSTGGGNPRFYPDGNQCPNWKAEHDVFALGSTIYEIFAGNPPYKDYPSSQVERLFQTRSLPDFSSIGMPAGMQRIVEECWSLRSQDASSIHDMILGLGSSPPHLARLQATYQIRDEPWR